MDVCSSASGQVRQERPEKPADTGRPLIDPSGEQLMSASMRRERPTWATEASARMSKAVPAGEAVHPKCACSSLI
jgi:hypothetical protein